MDCSSRAYYTVFWSYMRRGWVPLEIKDVRWRLDQGHLHPLLEHPETNMSRPGVEPEPPASQASHSLHTSVGANAVFLRIYLAWASKFFHNEWRDKSVLYLFSHSLTFDCGDAKSSSIFGVKFNWLQLHTPLHHATCIQLNLFGFFYYCNLQLTVSGAILWIHNRLACKPDPDA